MVNMKVITIIWRAVLMLHSNLELPFNFAWEQNHGRTRIVFMNGDERIYADEVRIKEDSIFIKMPVFDAEIRAKIISYKDVPVRMEGLFINHARTSDNINHFHADANQNVRFFRGGQTANSNFGGKWEVHFSAETPDSSDAIGEFVQNGNDVNGTFLTPTGDYRYLSGCVTDSTLNLSAFDGCHLYLFKAKMKSDGTLEGDYWAGSHWHEPWIGKRNNTFVLPDPDTIIKLKLGYEDIQFSFLGMDSNTVNFPSENYKGKVVILQFMGTWCPNCMDETNFLAPFYKSNKSKGFEIIGLAFEKFPDFGKAKNNVSRLKKRFNVDYPILIGCTNNKDSIARNLPMLGKIYSFPTTIFIDKKGKVRRIHTGYSGPATGIHYERWVSDFTKLVDKLLKE